MGVVPGSPPRSRTFPLPRPLRPRFLRPLRIRFASTMGLLGTVRWPASSLLPTTSASELTIRRCSVRTQREMGSSCFSATPSTTWASFRWTSLSRRPPPSLTALISILGGKTASPSIISDELRHLFHPDWDWEVTPISDHEFTAVFPNPVSLRYGTHSAELTLALNQLTVNISVPTVDPLAVAVLSSVWIQIRGLPPIAKKERVIRSMSRFLGKVIEVDAASLLRGPAVRAKVKTPDPTKLQTTLRIFFNNIGYDLHISVKEAPSDAPPGPTDGGGSGPDRGGGGGDDADHHHHRCRSPSSEEEVEDSPAHGGSPRSTAAVRPSLPAGSRPTATTEALEEGEDQEAIAAMLEAESTLPPGSSLALILSSPVLSSGDEGGSDASSVGLDVCPPSSPRIASPVPPSPPPPCAPASVVELVSALATPDLTAKPPATRPPHAKGHPQSA